MHVVALVRANPHVPRRVPAVQIARHVRVGLDVLRDTRIVVNVRVEVERVVLAHVQGIAVAGPAVLEVARGGHGLHISGPRDVRGLEFVGDVGVVVVVHAEGVVPDDRPLVVVVHPPVVPAGRGDVVRLAGVRDAVVIRGVAVRLRQHRQVRHGQLARRRVDIADRVVQRMVLQHDDEDVTELPAIVGSAAPVGRGANGGGARVRGARRRGSRGCCRGCRRQHADHRQHRGHGRSRRQDLAVPSHRALLPASESDCRGLQESFTAGDSRCRSAGGPPEAESAGREGEPSRTGCEKRTRSDGPGPASTDAG